MSSRDHSLHHTITFRETTTITEELPPPPVRISVCPSLSAGFHTQIDKLLLLMHHACTPTQNGAMTAPQAEIPAQRLVQPHTLGSCVFTWHFLNIQSRSNYTSVIILVRNQLTSRLQYVDSLLTVRMQRNYQHMNTNAAHKCVFFSGILFGAAPITCCSYQE